MVNAMSGVMCRGESKPRAKRRERQRLTGSLISAEGEQVGDQRIEVGVRETEHQAARHRVALARYDIRAGVHERLTQVLGSGARTALLGDRPRARELGSEAAALSRDVMTLAAIERPVDLASPRDRLRRGWLAAGEETGGGGDRDAPQDLPPHHAVGGG
jgi:hypothetical protein